MSKVLLGNLDYELRLLEKETYDKEIKDVIRKFLNAMELKGRLSEIRVVNYCQRLRVAARWIPDKFLTPDKEAIERVLKELRESNYKPSTQDTYIVMIKRFYKWYLGNDKRYPEFLDGIKSHVERTQITSEEIVSEDELSALLNACSNARDRALISTLYDSGARIGELLSARIKDLAFDEYGAVLRVNVKQHGKTGYRQIRMVGNSIPYLRAWLDNHPDRNNREAFLFCELTNGGMRGKLDYWDVNSMLRRTKERAGLTRRIHAHGFRHTAATLLAPRVSQTVLENQLGWRPGSKMSATYVHLSGKAQDIAMLKGLGKEVKEEDVGKMTFPKECPRCHTSNASDATYCRNCWLPFDLKLALEEEEKEKKREEAVFSTNAIDTMTKVLFNSLPEGERTKAFEKIIDQFLNDPEAREKLFREWKKKEEETSK
ncbi:MAG: tyrosine-type recombinase/integrase [Thermoplasmatales archaeon]|nr:tyrosine-type recombinase/integrase [Thermoplasmatales archaeon]